MLMTNFTRLLDPWDECESMRQPFFGQTEPSNAEFPAFNVWVSGDDAIVTSELPGIDRGAIEISVVGKTLTVRGSRRSEELAEGESFPHKERWFGQFNKTFELPFDIDADGIRAQLAGGILEISLPRAEAEKPRKIEIKSE
ncbi:MAG: Hsp20/alpha crystallin family protein [Nitrospiraceae bacterium]|nr:Hsp20/alpha crystallin family protein [Nitrospiraceae bacterium]